MKFIKKQRHMKKVKNKEYKDNAYSLNIAGHVSNGRVYIDSEEDLRYDDDFTINYKNKRIFEIYKKGLAGCCAISLLHTYWVKSNITVDKKTVIKSLLTEVVKRTKGHTYMINVVKDDDMDKILSDCTVFTCVKEFVNSNTQNIIRIYLSNNS